MSGGRHAVRSAHAAFDRRYAAFTAVASLTWIGDRVSKAWIEHALEPGQRHAVIEGFLYLTHARNPGAAFGWLAGWPLEWRVTGFALVTAIALVLIAFFLRALAPGDRRGGVALGLLAGGALGNLADRVPPLGSGSVVDFLHVRLWGGYAWPDFNLADAAIVAGVIVLVVDLVATEAAVRAGSGARGPSS